MSEIQPTSRPQRQEPHWFRFSLRTLLLVVAGVAIWLGIEVKEARRQQAAIMAIRDLGGWTHYDYEMQNGKTVPNARPWLPEWMLRGILRDFFHSVVEVNMVYDEDGPERLKNELFSDGVKNHLLAFPNLKCLLLCKSQATDDCLAVIGRLRRLERILMWDASEVTDAGVAHLRKLPKLRYVHLSNEAKFTQSHITDDSLRVFGGMPQLEGLSLQGNRFTDAGLEHLKGLKRLESLWVDLGISRITDDGLLHLYGLTRLKELAVQQTEVTDEGVSKLQAALPALKSVLR